MGDGGRRFVRGERLRAPIDACSNTDSAVTSLSAAFRLSASPRATSYGVGALRDPVQFALLGPGRVNAAIRSRPLRPIRPRRTLSPSLRVRSPGTAHCFLRGDAFQRPGC